jgi:hypothetical protein
MGSAPKKPKSCQKESTQKQNQDPVDLSIDVSNFINENPGDIYKDFEFLAREGEGSYFYFLKKIVFIGGFGSVFSAIERLTNLKRSIKIINKGKNSIDINNILLEIKILCNLVIVQ